MDGRVIPYADANGLDYYKGTPDWIHNPMAALVQRADENSIAHKEFQQSLDQHTGKLREENIDIGVDLDSPFYQIERHAVSGYPGYTQDFQRNADLRVPSRVMDRDSTPN